MTPDLTPAHRAAVEVMAEGELDAMNVWLRGDGPFEVCRYGRRDEPEIVVLDTAKTLGSAYATQAIFIRQERAIAALRALVEAGFWIGRWEPIETAPKDGTEVVTARSRSYGQDVSTDWYAVDPMSTERGWLIGTTHWTPLPPPPPEARDADAE